jgi:hypothetical protein
MMQAAYSYDAGPSLPKFTGKERDFESGLDNFGARFDSSSLGRFMNRVGDATVTARRRTE